MPKNWLSRWKAEDTREAGGPRCMSFPCRKTTGKPFLFLHFSSFLFWFSEPRLWRSLNQIQITFSTTGGIKNVSICEQMSIYSCKVNVKEWIQNRWETCYKIFLIQIVSRGWPQFFRHFNPRLALRYFSC